MFHFISLHQKKEANTLIADVMLLPAGVVNRTRHASLPVCVAYCDNITFSSRRTTRSAGSFLSTPLPKLLLFPAGFEGFFGMLEIHCKNNAEYNHPKDPSTRVYWEKKKEKKMDTWRW